MSARANNQIPLFQGQFQSTLGYVSLRQIQSPFYNTLNELHANWERLKYMQEQVQILQAKIRALEKENRLLDAKNTTAEEKLRITQWKYDRRTRTEENVGSTFLVAS